MRIITFDRLPVLAVAVGLIIWGAIESRRAGFDFLSAALVAGGLLVLGSWLTLEILNAVRRDVPDDGEE